MTKQSNQKTMQWARIGASARIAEIQAELAEIYRTFPDLKAGRHATGGTSRITPGGARKRQFSSAGKKAISQGMREYWARRKALAAKEKKAAAKN
jgi:hypothetical protein